MKSGVRPIIDRVVFRRAGLKQGVACLFALLFPIAAHSVRAEGDGSARLFEDGSHSAASAYKADAGKSETAKTESAGAPVSAPIAASLPRSAMETAGKPAAVDAVTGAPAAPKPPVIRNLLTFGGDLYLGGTNGTGVRARNTDGMWAGYGSAYPSLLCVNWQADEARGLHVSIGVGDMFTAAGTLLRQPVEATYQFPTAGGGKMTVGKFYVPFSTQEWEYESKYGMMFQKTQGALNYTGAVTYNFQRQAPNVYLRVGRQFGTRTTIGLSAGGGRGVFSDSSHAVAFGLDVAHDFGGVQFSTEYNIAEGGKGPFQFVYGKLALTRTGRFLPYIGAYYWHDTARELGQFHSIVAGLGYRMNRSLTIEGGYARGNARNILWLQSHITL